MGRGHYRSQPGLKVEVSGQCKMCMLHECLLLAVQVSMDGRSSRFPLRRHKLRAGAARHVV